MMDLTNVEFQYESAIDQVEEIVRNLRTLLLTPAGTCPLDRDFGLDYSLFMGMPMDVAQNALAVEIMDKVDKYESRVTVREVSCTATATGQLIAKVAIASA